MLRCSVFCVLCPEAKLAISQLLGLSDSQWVALHLA